MIREFNNTSQHVMVAMVIRRAVQSGLFAKLLTHPAVLVLASVVSIVLWMPFGFGYYDFPWKQSAAVLLLLVFVVALPVSSTIAIARSCRPQFLPVRFGVSILSLMIGLHGLFHMLHWWLYVTRR